MDGNAHPQGFLNLHLRGFSRQPHLRPHHPLPPLLPHQLHPHPYLPYLPLNHNFPLPRQENGLTFPSLTTRKGPPQADDLIGRLRCSPLPHRLMTAHLSLL